jgi:hypothetical protein
MDPLLRPHCDASRAASDSVGHLEPNKNAIVDGIKRHVACAGQKMVKVSTSLI